MTTSRGVCYRHGGENVSGGGAGDRVRHRGQRPLRADFVAGGVKKSGLRRCLGRIHRKWGLKLALFTKNGQKIVFVNP